MVYLNKFIAVVKCNGKILREIDKDIIQLPFGSEYSLEFKNLSGNNAGVNVSIDGKDVLDGRKLIVKPFEGKVELTRFIKDDLNKGNRFKFIQKTDKIVNHRGDRIDDGIIRVEFAFEEPQVSYTYTNDWSWSYPVKYRSSTGFNMNDTVSCYNASSTLLASLSVPKQDEGITVPGSISNQSFSNGHLGNMGKSEVIVFKLQGIDSNDMQVTQPITVKTKLECATCGTKNKSNHKFCSDCGTSLI